MKWLSLVLVVGLMGCGPSAAEKAAQLKLNKEQKAVLQKEYAKHWSPAVDAYYAVHFDSKKRNADDLKDMQEDTHLPQSKLIAKMTTRMELFDPERVVGKTEQEKQELRGLKKSFFANMELVNEIGAKIDALDKEKRELMK